MMKFTASMILTICTVAERWNRLPQPWLIGGSCGLLMQEIELPAKPRDLDIYIDKEAVGAFHQVMLDYAVDEPAFSATDKYSSTLAHYRIGELPIELVAGFEVRVPQALYRVDIEGLSSQYGPTAILDGMKVQCMPLAHELLFNLLRDRPDRYVPIAEKMCGDLERQLPALQAIVKNNRIGEKRLRHIADLLRIDAGTLMG